MKTFFRYAGALALGLCAVIGRDSPLLAASPAPTVRPVPSSATQVSFDSAFTSESMRVDLFHTGNGSKESYSLDEVAWEPVWPGTRRYLADPFGFGTYRFRVTDADTGTLLFSQGYAALFDEWRSTDEAVAGVTRSMSESVRFPWPKRPVIVHVDHRNRQGVMREMFSVGVDPNSHLISRARPYQHLGVLDLSENQTFPDQALDIVIVPEGYGAKDRDKLRADLKRFAKTFLKSEPWKAHASRIRIRGIEAISAGSGVTEPRKRIFRDTLLGASFNTFDSERYLTVVHTKTLRQIASLVPYDTIFVMANTSRYGGGGVYNQWSVFVSDNEYDDYVMLHEFGHHMGGLADEYYDSAISSDEDLMYPPGVEPWEPNLSSFLGADRGRIKWASLISPSTPVPTPEKGFENNVVGLFEGAGYKAKGLFRPQKDCKMFHKGLVGFCQVCTQSLQSMVHYYTGEDLRP